MSGDRDWVEVLVDGRALEPEMDLDVRHVEVDLGTNAPAQATVVLADPLLASLGTMSLGKEIEVRLADLRGQRRKLFVGQITEVSVDESDDQPSQVTVTALDRSHLLGLATAAASAQKVAPTDVIRQLCSKAGLRVSCPSMGSQVPYFLLATSAHQVLTELVTRHGHAWRYDRDGNQILVEPVPTSSNERGTVTLAFGQQLYHLRATQSGRFVGEATVRGWDPERGRSIVGKAKAQPPRADIVGGARTWDGTNQVLVSGQPVLDQAEADALAQSVVTTAQRRSVTVRGQAVLTPELLPNTWVEVKAATTGSSRSYYVDRVIHRYTPGRDRTVSTHFEGGNHPAAGPLPGQASVQGSPLRADALVVGVVTNNNDPEKLGRVRLKFPWLSDEDESNWARVASFGGGPGQGRGGARGSQFVPEVNDEVIAGFENGDLRRPVVLGTLYSPRSKSPNWARNQDKVNTRSITSRLGHVIEFADGTSPSEQFIRLTLANETTEVLLSEERISIKAPKGHEVKMSAGDTTVAFDKQSGILIKGQKVVIDATQIEIKGQASLKAEATTVEIKGQASLKAEAATVDVNGTAMTKIAGGQVMIN